MRNTILIIDDLASVRLYHKSFLTRKGYSCVEASDGEEGLDRLRQRTVDLILLDLVMPGMDGESFVDQLDRDAASGGIPVLVITSEESLARELIARAKRPIGVVTKPVMPAALLRAVEQLLPREAAVAAE
tara:strand:+ start:200 stop:589 length:390 start_codon:yes stop_codon:yes gene_type:complete